MQLQAERDHFINGGIRTGGGGSSSSSSLSSSPTSSAMSSPALASSPSLSPSLSPSTKVELSPQHLLHLRNALSQRQHDPSPPTPPPQPAFVASSSACPSHSHCQTTTSQATTSSSTIATIATTAAAAAAAAVVVDADVTRLVSPDAHGRRSPPARSRACSPVIPDLNPHPSATTAPTAAACQTTVATAPPAHAGQLALLPSELLFHILCYLPAVDLCQLALTSKFYFALARDRAVWRIKCRQHMLFSTRHLYAQPSVDWMAYYRYLHRSHLALERNWADATPQTVTLLEGHSSLVTSLELSLWTLVTASIDSTVRVWNLKTFECIQVLRCKHSITCITQCAAIGVVCARTSFGALIVWDIKSGQVVLQEDYALPQIASFMYMDERYIGYGATDGGVTIFDWSSRSELEIAGSYLEHTGDVIHVSILDKQIVISASTNGEALLYSLPKRRIIGRFLLPGAAQSIQFTPTICGNKVMFSTQEAIYEYEIDIQDMILSFNREMEREEMEAQQRLKTSHAHPPPPPPPPSTLLSASTLPSSSSSSSSSSSTLRPAPHFHPSQVLGAPNRNWKPSNSLLSQIRAKIGPGKFKALALDERPTPSPPPQPLPPLPSSSSWTESSLSSSPSSSLLSSFSTATPTGTTTSATATTPVPPKIPTRFPRIKSMFCIPPGSRILDHGTTSARCSYAVFMREGCATLDDMVVYSQKTKRLRTWRGTAVERMLRDAVRNRYYTTMECNEHCAVVTSGEKVYVMSFLPPGV